MMGHAGEQNSCMGMSLTMSLTLDRVFVPLLIVDMLSSIKFRTGISSQSYLDEVKAAVSNRVSGLSLPDKIEVKHLIDIAICIYRVKTDSTRTNITLTLF